MSKLKCFGLLTALVSSFACADGGNDWNYKDQANWGQINPKYASCNGINQTPINIQNAIKAQLKPLKYDYADQAIIKDIVNNGHTVQASFDDGAKLTFEGKTFTLKQFHVHTPSENLINGKQYPLELHMVHAAEDGELAVIGVMYKEGKENPQLAKVISNFPEKSGDTVQPTSKILASEFIVAKKNYYRFNGSLTTPPCTEGVRWIVLKDIQQASKAQIQLFYDSVGHSNSRPIQKIGARTILE